MCALHPTAKEYADQCRSLWKGEPLPGTFFWAPATEKSQHSNDDLLVRDIVDKQLSNTDNLPDDWDCAWARQGLSCCVQ